jgi:transcriptional regulator with XRE-family HTH domain
VAQRAGISRTTLHKAETGDGAITLGTCLRVLAALGLEADLHALAADGQVARRLQDQAVLPERELWAHKRERQARDLHNVHTGKLSNDDMSWFAGGKAKAAKLVNSVY